MQAVTGEQPLPGGLMPSRPSASAPNFSERISDDHDVWAFICRRLSPSWDDCPNFKSDERWMNALILTADATETRCRKWCTINKQGKITSYSGFGAESWRYQFRTQVNRHDQLFPRRPLRFLKLPLHSPRKHLQTPKRSRKGEKVCLFR